MRRVHDRNQGDQPQKLQDIDCRILSDDICCFEDVRGMKIDVIIAFELIYHSYRIGNVAHPNRDSCI